MLSWSREFGVLLRLKKMFFFALVSRRKVLLCEEEKKYFPMEHLLTYLTFIFILLIPPLPKKERKDCAILPSGEKGRLAACDLEPFWGLRKVWCENF